MQKGFPSVQSWRRLITPRKVVALASVIILSYVIYKLVTMPTDWGAFRQVQASSILIIVCAELFFIATTTVAWKILQDRLRKISLGTAWRVILPTFYAGYFPFRGTMILLRMYFAKREGIPYSEGGPSLFVHFGWRWVLHLMAIPFLFLILPGLEAKVLLSPLIVVVGLILLYLLRCRIMGVLGALLQRVLRRSSRSLALTGYLDEMQKNLKLLMGVRPLALYSAIQLTSFVLTYYAMSLLWQDLGYSVAFYELFLITCAASTVGLISQLPGGIGATEATYAYLLSLLGVPGPFALAVGFMWRFILMAVNLTVSGSSWGLSILLARRADHKGLGSSTEEGWEPE